MPSNGSVLTLDHVNTSSVRLAGGKASALGEVIHALPELPVPEAFVITADATAAFLDANELFPVIDQLLHEIPTDDHVSAQFKARQIRQAIETAEVPHFLQEAILDAYYDLSGQNSSAGTAVAVRSSATAEDLATASFAGMYSSFLYVTNRSELFQAVRRCVASLYTERAIQYRDEHRISHDEARMAVLVQRMISSDDASSGVAFTVDSELGFENGIVINSVFGLCEGLVQGRLCADEYLLFKPALAQGHYPIIGSRLGTKHCKEIWSVQERRLVTVELPSEQRDVFSLSDDAVIRLGQYCLSIERHFSLVAGSLVPMDIEWAIDPNGKLFIVQARPLAGYSRPQARLRTYVLVERSAILTRGQPVGRKVGRGRVANLRTLAEMPQFRAGEVLVTDMTDPAWLPIMKKAAAIVTNRGGRTCHAAIISREMGIPCIIGTNNATELLRSGDPVTVSCVGPDEGHVYQGLLDFQIKETVIDTSPTRTKLMLLTGLPDAALAAANLPSDGVAMGREEFIVYSYIGIHPLALIHYEDMSRDFGQLEGLADRYQLSGMDRIRETIEAIDRVTRGYQDKPAFLVKKLAEGMAKIAASVYPKEVYMKLCDFKTNEFRALIGGFLYEPIERNPMIGWRSASRYYAARYRPVFELECRAFIRAREEMGFSNMHIMIPFCRTIAEGRNVIQALAECGIVQHKDGLLVTAETEVPASVIQAVEFAEIFDMFNIGSNDLTQMVLGTDRDSELLQDLFDERNPAVLKFIKEAIEKIHSVPPKMIAGKEVKVRIGLTGVAVSNYPDFAAFLIRNGIDYIGLDPDPESFLSMRQNIIEFESRESECQQTSETPGIS